MAHLNNVARGLKLCALGTVLIHGTLLAQIPAHELHFVTREADSYQRESKSSQYTINEDVCTDAYQVHVEMATTGKAKGQLAIYVNDKNTAKQIGKSVFDPRWTDGSYFDNLIQLSGKLYMVYEVLDRKSGQVDVYAQEITLPQPAFAGAPKLIGTIKFDPKSLSWSGKLYARLYVSDNGEFTAFYFDGIRSKEDEQLVLVFMMNADLDPLWKQGYRIEFDSEKIATASVKVSDRGLVYALMGARFKNRAVTNKSINYGFQVFGFSETGMANKPIELGSNLSIVACDMVLAKGTTPVVGGFQVEQGASTDATQGFFNCTFDPVLEQQPVVHATAFSNPLDERIGGPRLYAKSNGGVMLSGLSHRSAGTSASESYLFAGSFDAQGEVEWSRVVPRSLIVSKSDEDYGYRGFFWNDRLMLMLPELQENLANYKAGRELKKIRKGPDMRLFIGFSETGEPSYAKFGAPADYEIKVRYLPWDMSVGNDTFAIPCTKKSSKAETWGVLFMDML